MALNGIAFVAGDLTVRFGVYSQRALLALEEIFKHTEFCPKDKWKEVDFTHLKHLSSWSGRGSSDIVGRLPDGEAYAKLNVYNCVSVYNDYFNDKDIDDDVALAMRTIESYISGVRRLARMKDGKKFMKSQHMKDIVALADWFLYKKPLSPRLIGRPFTPFEQSMKDTLENEILKAKESFISTREQRAQLDALWRAYFESMEEM